VADLDEHEAARLLASRLFNPLVRMEAVGHLGAWLSDREPTLALHQRMAHLEIVVATSCTSAVDVWALVCNSPGHDRSHGVDSATKDGPLDKFRIGRTVVLSRIRVDRPTEVVSAFAPAFRRCAVDQVVGRYVALRSTALPSVAEPPSDSS